MKKLLIAVPFLLFLLSCSENGPDYTMEASLGGESFKGTAVFDNSTPDSITVVGQSGDKYFTITMYAITSAGEVQLEHGRQANFFEVIGGDGILYEYYLAESTTITISEFRNREVLAGSFTLMLKRYSNGDIVSMNGKFKARYRNPQLRW